MKMKEVNEPNKKEMDKKLAKICHSTANLIDGKQCCERRNFKSSSDIGFDSFHPLLPLCHLYTLHPERNYKLFFRLQNKAIYLNFPDY